jgi:two-component system nitrogen regulation response regulator NtrX
LIVEDQPEVTRLLAALLHQAGYDTAAATDGDDALAQAAERRPDVALLDLTLPGVDGISVLRALRDLHPGLPSIILTGHGSPDRAGAAMRNGAFDFLTKPFHKAELLATIAKALTSWRPPATPEVSRV